APGKIIPGAAVKSFRLPGLIVGCRCRCSIRSAEAAGRHITRRNTGCIRQMWLFPVAHPVFLLARRRVDTSGKPAMPTRRHPRGLGLTIIDDPTPVAIPLAVVLVAELILTDEFALTGDEEPGPHGLAVPPGEEFQQKSLEF